MCYLHSLLRLDTDGQFILFSLTSSTLLVMATIYMISHMWKMWHMAMSVQSELSPLVVLVQRKQLDRYLALSLCWLFYNVSFNVIFFVQAYFITNNEPIKFWEFISLIVEGLGYERWMEVLWFCNLPFFPSFFFDGMLFSILKHTLVIG